MKNERGFLEYSRKEPEYRNPEERIRDFEPVETGMPDADATMQAARCMECGTPFCHGCGCPLGNVVPETNELVRTNRWQEALELLLTTNPFPEFTARVCPALCEASCVLGINDQPVTIRQIEMAIVEKGFEKGWIRPRPPANRLPGRVAVIGSGPAGLATANAVNKAGYSVTIFDRDKHAGGVLRYGIPDFKLEKRILDRRLRLMKEEGIEFELGVSVGDDVSTKYLRDRFDAICLACGSREPRDLKVPGRGLKGVRFAMEYLARQNRILMGEPAAVNDDDLDAAGKDVVIIGGGDTGSDCLGTALRQGARKVLQFEIMPKPPVARPESSPWPAWPNILRESSSHKEGGERRWCVNTVAFLGDNGHLRRLQCVEVEWTTGPAGGPQFREKPGTGFEVEAGLVLLALGFAGPGRNRLADDLGVERDGRGNIRVDGNHMTNSTGVFSAGDMAHGQSLVVRAMTDGLATARGIVDYLQQRGKHD